MPNFSAYVHVGPLDYTPNDTNGYMLLFNVQIGAIVMANATTGTLLEYYTLTWQQCNVSFIALNNSVVFIVSGISASGIGNDFVIDDIALRLRQFI